MKYTVCYPLSIVYVECITFNPFRPSEVNTKFHKICPLIIVIISMIKLWKIICVVSLNTQEQRPLQTIGMENLIILK